jgi:hypothetical protein
MLRKHLDGPVKCGERTLVLRRKEQGKDAAMYKVDIAA